MGSFGVVVIEKVWVSFKRWRSMRFVGGKGDIDLIRVNIEWGWVWGKVICVDCSFFGFL